MRLERWLLAILARLKSLVGGRRVTAELDEELQFHLDRHIDREIAAGLDPAAARRAALCAFGGLQQRREECRELHRIRVWDALIQDVRYTGRTVQRSRGFAVGAVAILALGIGASTAVFSVVNAVLIEPLSYPEPHRIVQLLSSTPAETSTLASVPRFVLWRRTTHAFQQIAAWHAGSPGINMTSGGWPEHIKAVHASREYFQLFGGTPLLGRTFSAEEDHPEGPRVAVLSHGLWRRRFGGDPHVVGRPIVLGGDAYEVVGVLGPTFAPEPTADLWMPLQADVFSQDHTSFLHVAARLRPGVTLERARTEVGMSALQFRRQFPAAIGAHERFTAEPFRDVMLGDVRPALQLLGGAVILLLLVACANAASLLLARASRRRMEIATRAALGASPERLVRQLLCESLLLAGAGGALGLGLAHVGVNALLAWSPALLPRLADGVSLDWRVLLFASIVSGVTGFIFGLVPALNLARIDLSTAFRDATENRSIPARQRRMLSALVIAEISLTLVLLAGSALMIRTFLSWQSVDRGYDPDHVLAVDMALAGKGFDDTSRLTALLASVQLRLQNRASVAGVAMTRGLPREQNVGFPFIIGRRQLFAAGGTYHGVATWSGVSAGYFSILRMQLRLGREFTDLDVAGAPAVAIVNESMARRYWQEASPLGEEITIGSGAGRQYADQPRRIVGVVADVRDPESGVSPTPAIYLPVAQLSDGMTAWNNRYYALTWVVRTTVDPRLAAPAIEQELRNASGGIPLARTRIVADVVDAATARTEFTMLLVTSFAAVGLILAATGMYTLMAYSVRQRSQEIGIRMAFGARPADVRHDVVFDGGQLAVAGVAMGSVAALLFTRILDALIVGGPTWDPPILLPVAALLTAVTLLAAWLPARRATGASALDALKVLD